MILGFVCVLVHHTVLLMYSNMLHARIHFSYWKMGLEICSVTPKQLISRPPQTKSNPYECGLSGGFSIFGLVCFETRPLLIPIACCLRLAPNPCTFMCIPKYKEHHIMVPCPLPPPLYKLKYPKNVINHLICDLLATQNPVRKARSSPLAKLGVIRSFQDVLLW